MPKRNNQLGQGKYAPSAVRYRKDDRLSRWVTELAARRHPHITTVALANKTVRVASAMLNHGSDYHVELAAA